MISYLKDGWYSTRGKRQLRSGVIDGAIDAAGMLFRAEVPSQALSSTALKLRTMITMADPFMEKGATLSPRGLKVIRKRLERLIEHYPALNAFIVDCLDHVQTPRDLRALYLHLFHIAQVMQLLGAATHLPRISPPKKHLRKKRAI